MIAGRILPLALLTALAVTLAGPAPAAAQDDLEGLTHELEHLERTMWHSWATHDAAAFQENIVENSVNIGPWGTVTGKEAIVAMVANNSCALEDAQFSDWKANQVSDETVILTYNAVQKGSCQGAPLPERVAVSSVYVRQDDRWMSASYHETPLYQMPQ